MDERGGGTAGVVVRAATAVDAPAVARLAGLAASTVRQLDADLAAGARRHAVVATEGPDGPVVGFAMTTAQADALHVLDVAVASDRRRRGIATRLLAGLAELAVRAGVPALTLEVREGNVGARALYERLGFDDHGARPGYYPDGEDARIMWHVDPAALATRPRD